MSRLYAKLNIKAKDELFKKVVKESKKLYRNHKKNKTSFLSEIANILLVYKIADDLLKLSDAEQHQLKNYLFDIINNFSKNEFDFEKTFMNDMLPHVTRENYNLKQYVVSLGKDIETKRIKYDDIEGIVNKTISNKKWSDRLWDNKISLEVDLKKSVTDFLEGKTSVNDIYKRVNDIYSINAFNTERLVNNEIFRCQAESDELFFQDFEVDKVQYIGTLDDRTCEDCGGYDLEIFDLNDPNRPELPLHVLCRCTYVEYVEGWEPSRLDNQSRETINYVDYENWKENNNL